MNCTYGVEVDWLYQFMTESSMSPMAKVYGEFNYVFIVSHYKSLVCKKSPFNMVNSES